MYDRLGEQAALSAFLAKSAQILAEASDFENTLHRLAERVDVTSYQQEQARGDIDPETSGPRLGVSPGARPAGRR